MHPYEALRREVWCQGWALRVLQTSLKAARGGECWKLLRKTDRRHTRLHPDNRWETLHLNSHQSIFSVSHFSHFYDFILPVLCHQASLRLLFPCAWAHSFMLLSDSSSNGLIALHYYICTCSCPFSATLSQLLRDTEGCFSKTNISLHGCSVCVCSDSTQLFIFDLLPCGLCSSCDICTVFRLNREKHQVCLNDSSISNCECEW